MILPSSCFCSDVNVAGVSGQAEHSGAPAAAGENGQGLRTRVAGRRQGLRLGHGLRRRHRPAADHGEAGEQRDGGNGEPQGLAFGERAQRAGSSI